MARGGTRLIFKNPVTPGRLIKVLRPDKFSTVISEGLLGSRSRCLYRIYQQEINEYLYLKSVSANVGPLVSPIFGIVETSMGLGLDVEMIPSSDGGLAPTLDDLIRKDGVSPQMRCGVNRLARALGELGVIVSDFKSHNLVLLPDGVSFCVVDG
ncbi:MAG: YrbL family protein, partial [Cyanobium sp.]